MLTSRSSSVHPSCKDQKWGWGWGKYYVDKSAAQKQNLPQSRELDEGTGGAGSKGPLRGVGVVWSYVFCLRGAELMIARCFSPLIGHHLRQKKNSTCPALMA